MLVRGDFMISFSLVFDSYRANVTVDLLAAAKCLHDVPRDSS